VRVDILAIGSEGDVRPNVALGRGLQQAGHRVRIVALHGFDELVGANGLEYLPIARSPREIAATAEGREWVQDRGSTAGFIRGFVRIAREFIDSGVAAYWQASRDVDALIVTAMGLPIGVHVAERMGVPLLRVSFAPTRHDWANRRDVLATVRGNASAFVWAACRLLMWTQVRATTNATRAKILGLGPLASSDPFRAMDRAGVPILDAYSPSVVPRAAHLEPWLHITGYWFLEAPSSWTPPPVLADFLESGPTPVFVGFGSTPFPSADGATDLVVRALAAARRRGIVVAGGSGLATGRLTDDVLSVDSVPHDWLLPRVGCAVHHGGAGVTGAALRAGLPSVVVPIFGDQPFWGRRVHELGAGPKPIRARQLTAEKLAAAIRRASYPEVQVRAAALGQEIRRENGVARSVAIIRDYVGGFARARRVS
jgi:sterol 3beta-glucosyltransferase